jgi:hypothetical protein
MAGDSIAVAAGSATEADRSVSVWIGTLAGPAAVTSSDGRHLNLPALSQTVISGDALPATTTPLHLHDSAEEARAVPTLVSDDLALRTLARGFDRTGTATANLVDASWTGTTATMPAGTSTGERVLPLLIADATRTAGGTAQQRYDEVIGWRAQGGSWGVVDHRLSGRAAEVVATLASLAQPPAGAAATTVLAAGPGAPAIGHSRPAGGRGGHHSTSPTSPTSPSGPGNGPAPTPTPTPTPSTGLIGTLTSTVQGVVGTVLGLLPVKHSTTAGAPKPKPTPTSTGLLHSVVGSLTGGH